MGTLKFKPEYVQHMLFCLTVFHILYIFLGGAGGSLKTDLHDPLMLPDSGFEKTTLLGF